MIGDGVCFVFLHRKHLFTYVTVNPSRDHIFFVFLRRGARTRRAYRMHKRFNILFSRYQ